MVHHLYHLILFPFYYFLVVFQMWPSKNILLVHIYLYYYYYRPITKYLKSIFHKVTCKIHLPSKFPPMQWTAYFRASSAKVYGQFEEKLDFPSYSYKKWTLVYQRSIFSRCQFHVCNVRMTFNESIFMVKMSRDRNNSCVSYSNNKENNQNRDMMSRIL